MVPEGLIAVELADQMAVIVLDQVDDICDPGPQFAISTGPVIRSRAQVPNSISTTPSGPTDNVAANDRCSGTAETAAN